MTKSFHLACSGLCSDVRCSDDYRSEDIPTGGVGEKRGESESPEAKERDPGRRIQEEQRSRNIMQESRMRRDRSTTTGEEVEEESESQWPVLF